MKYGVKNTTTPHPVGTGGFGHGPHGGGVGTEGWCPAVGASIRKATWEISFSEGKGGKGGGEGMPEVVHPELQGSGQMVAGRVSFRP